MRSSPALTRLLFILLLMSVGWMRAGESKPPDQWRKVDAIHFSFSVPLDLKPMPTRGIDSYVENYRGANIDLSFDYGLYSDPLKYADKAGSASKTVKIDGKKAKIVSFPNPNSGYRFETVIAVHFADLGDGQTKLTFWANCRDKTEYATCERIFSTIRFNR